MGNRASAEAVLGTGTSMNRGRFVKGNNAAAKPSKKAVAAMIRQRLEKNRDSLSNAEFTALVSKFDKLTAKRPRRHRKEPEGKKVSDVTFADRLTGEEAETQRMVLQIEAERREARQKERNRNTA